MSRKEENILGTIVFINSAFLNLFAYTLLSVCAIEARAAVFEQDIEGKIVVMTDGASVYAPSGRKQRHTSDNLTPERRVTSVVTNSEGKIPAFNDVFNPVPFSNQQNQPRLMSRSLSQDQLKYWRLAVNVAAAKHSSQVNAIDKRIDRQTFVALFTAMIQRESNFNPQAVSPVGAKGLGQLMPGTAKDLGVCNVFEARDNLEGSANYLSEMWTKFGSPELALAAYNAGPGAVMEHSGVPPYRETRQYIADIMYHAKRTNEIPKLVAAMDFQAATYLTKLEHSSSRNASRSRIKYGCETEI